MALNKLSITNVDAKGKRVSGNKKRISREELMAKIRCFKCNGMGHKAADCKNPGNKPIFETTPDVATASASSDCLSEKIDAAKQDELPANAAEQSRQQRRSVNILTGAH